MKTWPFAFFNVVTTLVPDEIGETLAAMLLPSLSAVVTFVPGIDLTVDPVKLLDKEAESESFGAATVGVGDGVFVGTGEEVGLGVGVGLTIGALLSIGFGVDPPPPPPLFEPPLELPPPLPPAGAATIAKERVIGLAALNDTFPGCEATTEQTPAFVKEITRPTTVQAPEAAYRTDKPEVATAERVNGPGMVC